jgi:hypothetical protein
MKRITEKRNTTKAKDSYTYGDISLRSMFYPFSILEKDIFERRGKERRRSSVSVCTRLTRGSVVLSAAPDETLTKSCYRTRAIVYR